MRNFNPLLISVNNFLSIGHFKFNIINNFLPSFQIQLSHRNPLIKHPVSSSFSSFSSGKSKKTSKPSILETCNPRSNLSSRNLVFVARSRSLPCGPRAFFYSPGTGSPVPPTSLVRGCRRCICF